MSHGCENCWSTDFEEGEDDEGVLLALCNGLENFFEALDAGEGASKKHCGRGDTHMFSILSGLLLRILLHRDRELKAAALRAYVSLLKACYDPAVLQDIVIPQVFELSEDDRDVFRQAAAYILPDSLRCAHRCASQIQLQNKQHAHITENEQQPLDAIRDLKDQLLAAYVRLCGDKNCAVQLAAGQQLPVFMDYIAAEVEILQCEHDSQHKTPRKANEGAASASDGRIGELMVAVYTAAQKFTLSPNVGSSDLC